MPREIPSVSPATRARNPELFGENMERVIDSCGAVTEEDKLHYEIIEYCKNQSPPWVYFHGSMDHVARRTKGEPDFEILASRGRVFLIECKAKGGKVSTDQRDIIHWAGLLGHTIHVVTSMKQFKEIVECN